MNRVFIRLFLLFVPVFVISSCNGGYEGSIIGGSIDDALDRPFAVGKYELCPTDDNSIFLNLDTSSGQIWVVSLGDENKRVQFALTDKAVAGNWDGRFSIKATNARNIFLLFDSSTGNCWQLKWDMDKDKRYVVPVKNDSAHATLLKYN